MSEHNRTPHDRAEITEVLLKYFRALDRLDRDLLSSIVAEDAELDYPGAFTGNKTDFLDWVLGVVGACSSTMHFSGNMLIDVDGDLAQTETYAIAYHTVDAGAEHEWAGKLVTMWLRYVDVLERGHGGWQLTRRVVAHVWTRFEEDTMQVSPASPGRRDRSDPIYSV